MADRRKYPVCGLGQIRRHLNLDRFLEDRLSKNELKQWILARSKAELTGILGCPHVAQGQRVASGAVPIMQSGVDSGS